MRISCLKSDPGYTPLVQTCAVIVDGRKMMDVLTADEEAGYILHYVRKNGELVVNEFGDEQTAELTGVSVEVLFKPQGAMFWRPNFLRTAEWLTACGKEVGNIKHLSVQVGCHLEEVAEFVQQLDFVGFAEQDTSALTLYLEALAGQMKRGTMALQGNGFKDRAKALDSLCDQNVTLDGVAFLAGFSKMLADQVVLASNEAKLNPDGTPVILPGGKIGKREGWVAPDLSPFV